MNTIYFSDVTENLKVLQKKLQTNLFRTSDRKGTILYLLYYIWNKWFL